MSTGMVTAEIIRPDALTPSHVEAWTAFRAAEPAFCNPLFGPGWAQAVGRVRPDTYIAVLKHDGRVSGFLPHQRARGGLGRPVGAPFSDLHALVAEPGQRMDLAEAVRAAGLSAFRYTALTDPQGRSSGVTGRASAHVVVQNGSDDLMELFRQRNAKRFKNWRRLGHKLDREHGGAELVADDPSADAYDQVMGWKRTQLRRSGLHDVYRPAWVQRLMSDLYAAKGGRFGGLFITLRAGGQVVAGEFGVREDGCFHPWVAAYDPAFAPYSPGMLLQFRIIEEMRSLGLRRYDLGVSSDHYKAPMATHQLETLSGVARGLGRRTSAWDSALTRSPLAARIGQRWEQIAAVENTALGRMQGVVTAVRDGPKRLAGGGSAAA